MPALRTRDTALEVTTDAPQPPTLTIISPTPRAFTFPSAHNLNDSSPYSSPSNSPFEPDLRPLALSSCTTPPPPFSMIRTLSPASSFTSSSPSPSTSHKRRKSSSSSCDVERRPKKGDEDYVKRPENAFILFRRKCCEERQAASSSSSDPSDPSSTASSEPPVKKQRQADLSKTISQQWKGLPAEERAYWEQLAKEKKKEHEKLHPNYVYRPQRAKDKEGRSIKNSKRSTSVNKGRRGSDYGQDTDSEYLSSATTGSSVSFVVPMAPRHHGRSASAPTPPLPYQTVQVPSVYHMTPSCPTSPSLLPMISRRSAGSGNPEDVMQNFDFLPSEPLMMSQFGNGFEGVQSSDFLRGMFNIRQSSTPHPLSLPPHNEPHLLPHQMISPCSTGSGSGSSGPSSPMSGPYTPTMLPLAHSFSQLASTLPNDECSPEHQRELEMQMQVQQDMEYQQGYTWGSNDGEGLWPAGAEIHFGDDDFDLNSIPPIELGMPKYSEDSLLTAPVTYGQYDQDGSAQYGYAPQEDYSQHEYSQDFMSSEGMLGYDEMIAGQSF